MTEVEAPRLPHLNTENGSAAQLGGQYLDLVQDQLVVEIVDTGGGLDIAGADSYEKIRLDVILTKSRGLLCGDSIIEEVVREPEASMF